MNTQYEAIITLGRSIENIDQDGWTTGNLGTWSAPKCAVGHISFALMNGIHYIAASSFSVNYPSHCEAADLAYRALIETLTEQQLAELGETCDALDCTRDGAMVAYDTVKAGEGQATDYECLVTICNDELISDATEAKRWFSDAIDVLAKELPVPSQPLFPAVTDAATERVAV